MTEEEMRKRLKKQLECSHEETYHAAGCDCVTCKECGMVVHPCGGPVDTGEVPIYAAPIIFEPAGEAVNVMYQEDLEDKYIQGLEKLRLIVLQEIELLKGPITKWKSRQACIDRLREGLK